MAYQNRIDPARLISIDETWTTTNMAPLADGRRADNACFARRVRQPVVCELLRVGLTGVKHWMLKAARRTVDAVYNAVAEILPLTSPAECSNLLQGAPLRGTPEASPGQTAPPCQKRACRKRRLARARGVVEHPRWDLQPGIRVRPLSVQRKTTPPALSIVPCMPTRRPNDACHRYKSSRKLVPWAFPNLVVQSPASHAAHGGETPVRVYRNRLSADGPGLRPDLHPTAPNSVTSVR